MWPLPNYSTFRIRELQDAYDYIIVGGGTAGCVLASRLSEHKHLSVLVIEKGKPSFSWASRVPLLSSNFQSDGTRTFKFESAPQAHVGGRKMEIVGGKALGGTSRINGMLYTRGLPAAYNSWSESGRKGWSYDDLHPYFLKSEGALDADLKENHNASGEWSNRSHKTRFFATADRAVQAAKKLGFPFIEDINSATFPVVGFTKFHYTIDQDGRRSDTASAFLPPSLVSDRKSRLHICTDTIVTRLEITSVEGLEKLSVTGVHLQAAESDSVEPVFIKAKREVIMCAGPFSTPQILMLSGIGPRDHLEAHSISVHKDLPGVGSNLQDHIGVPILYNIPLSDSLLAMQNSPWVAIQEIIKYLFTGRGMLLGPAHELSLFARSDLLSDKLEHEVKDPSQLDGRIPTNIPDIEVMTIAWGKTDDKSLGGFSLWGIPIRPLSLGTVRLRSNDPRAPPLCDPNLLGASEDRVILHTALRLCLRLKEQMLADGYPITDYSVPSSDSAADLDKHIAEWGQSIYHYASSCRMAPEDDAKPGVVDDELRVHGLDGLRVADSSIFPNILATHLQAATVVVAEKCADMLLDVARS